MADSIMAELNAAPQTPDPSPTEPVAPAAAPAKPAEPAAKPAAPAAAKPAKPAATPAKPAAPAAKADDKALDWKTAPANFRAAHEKLQQESARQTTELNTKIATTESKMRELEKREFLTPEQKEQYKRLDERQKQLEAELYSRNYQESPDFKKKWDAKSREVWDRISANLKSLQVDLEGTPREATFSDVQKVKLALDESEAAMFDVAEQMFGKKAPIITSLVTRLKGIEDEARAEVKQKRDGWEQEIKTNEQKRQEEGQTYIRLQSEFDAQISQKYFPQIADNPDYNKALEEGLKFIDTHTGNYGKQTVEQRAKTTAIIRRMAASVPAKDVLISQLTAKNTELETLVKKLQGSDPGAGGDDSGGGGGGSEPSSGTDTLTAEIEKLQRENT